MKKQIASDTLRSSSKSSSESSLGASRLALYRSIYGPSPGKAASKPLPKTLNPIDYLKWKPTSPMSILGTATQRSAVLSPRPLRKEKPTIRNSLISRLERTRLTQGSIKPQKNEDLPKRNPSTVPVSPHTSVILTDSKVVSEHTPMSPRSVGDTFSSLMDLERDVRKNKTWSVTKPVEIKANKEPLKEKSQLLDIQPIMNLRRIDTFELLRTDSNVSIERKLPEISRHPKEQKPHLGKVLEVDELERMRRASVTSERDMKDWISDYNSATAAVLTDTKFLIKDQRSGHSVPERLLKV